MTRHTNISARLTITIGVTGNEECPTSWGNACFKSVRSSVRAAVRGEYYNVQTGSQRPKSTRSP